MRIAIFTLLFLFFSAPAQAARDPKVEEMPYVQEIAFYLRENVIALESLAAGAAQVDPQVKRMVPLVERLSERAQVFYEKAMKNSKSPWRSVSSYKDLDRAFAEASSAFLAQPVYRIDPRLLEEIAYLMGGLLGFYTEPVYSYTVEVVYPRAVYGWIPSYYNFSQCRFANPRLYPWSKRISFGTPRR